MYIILSFVVLVEAKRIWEIMKTGGWGNERRDYSIIVSMFIIAVLLDEPLRKFGGMKGYFTGATLQHVLFFFWMPRWVERTIGTKNSNWLGAGVYYLFHLPNFPLTVITLGAGFVFAVSYHRWRAHAFPILVFLHYVGGSILKGMFYLNLQVGILFLKRGGIIATPLFILITRSTLYSKPFPWSRAVFIATPGVY